MSRQPFFIYIVESSSALDLYHRRTEGQVLADALRLANLTCVTRCAISREAFYAAFQVGLREEMANLAPALPIIHISSHGDGEGISLSSGETLSWLELGALLEPINAALKNQLIVAMSCCNGYSGIRMAMKEDDSPMPFFALIGTWQSPTLSDSVVAFSAFYHRLFKGAHIKEAVEAMNVASGCDFRVEWAENSKQQYLDFLKTYNPLTAVRQLADTAPAPPSATEKFGQTKVVDLSSAA
jgi:hypothetical protein